MPASLELPKARRDRLQQEFVAAYSANDPRLAAAALQKLDPEDKDLVQDPVMLYQDSERSVPTTLRHLAAMAAEGNPEWTDVEQVIERQFDAGATAPEMPSHHEISDFNSWPVDAATFMLAGLAYAKKLTPAETAGQMARLRAAFASKSVSKGHGGIRR